MKKTFLHRPPSHTTLLNDPWPFEPRSSQRLDNLRLAVSSKRSLYPTRLWVYSNLFKS